MELFMMGLVQELDLLLLILNQVCSMGHGKIFKDLNRLFLILFPTQMHRLEYFKEH